MDNTYTASDIETLRIQLETLREMAIGIASSLQEVLEDRPWSEANGPHRFGNLADALDDIDRIHWVANDHKGPHSSPVISWDREWLGPLEEG